MYPMKPFATYCSIWMKTCMVLFGVADRGVASLVVTVVTNATYSRIYIYNLHLQLQFYRA